VPKRILNRQELAQVVQDLRSQGKRIVATNGCFDIVHVGHVRYLEQAQQLGDVLVVGINSDTSVQKLKGPHRPVNGEQDRAEVLAALRFVDYVSIFNEPTADEFLKAASPDIYAKGGDYTPESLPETPLVRSLGAEVVILNLVPGKSTTSIVERLRQS
jgi:rfaE bifunctional protein nucleotidyltransferase chain/domain